MSNYSLLHLSLDSTNNCGAVSSLTSRWRFVAGGHRTDTPACMTNSSVVSRDSVRLAFLIAALNDLVDDSNIRDRW
jgi:hypothetical protein